MKDFKKIRVHIVTDCNSLNLSDEVNETEIFDSLNLKRHIIDLKKKYKFTITGHLKKNIIFLNKSNLLSLTILDDFITWEDL